MAIYCEGRPATVDELGVLALANDGHFTTLQVRGGAVQGFDLHLRRLQDGSRELFGLTLDEHAVRAAMRDALGAAGVADASLRLSVVARELDILRPETVAAQCLLVSVSAPRHDDAEPIRVRGYRFERSHAQLKHVGLFPLLQLRRRARREGFDDALLLDARDRITEGVTWNIGFWDGQTVVWPRGPALRGTRERLLQQWLDLPQRHMTVAVTDIPHYRAAFACNANGVRLLRGIDDIALAQDKVLLERMRNALAEVPWESL